MDIYARDVIGEAWQYNGDVKSMPSWAKSSSEHHVEIKENGTVHYWKGNEHLIVYKGDWFVSFYSFYGGTVSLYSDDAFRLNFTFSDPTNCKTGSVAFEKYRSKPATVYAWQYTGELHFSELPGWVIDLIVHHKLGYHSAFNPVTNSDTELFELYYEDVWVPILNGDWLVRYNEYSFGVVHDDDFNEYFEQIE